MHTRHDVLIDEIVRLDTRKHNQRRQCNLCENTFRSRHKFEYYCTTCRKESELLRFAEWMPSLDDDWMDHTSVAA